MGALLSVSSGNTSRPTSPRLRKATPWATGCPRMSRTRSGVTCAVASWPTGSLGPGAPVVVTSSWSGSLAGNEDPVPRAQPATWPRPPPTWWTTSSPTSRSARTIPPPRDPEANAWARHPHSAQRSRPDVGDSPSRCYPHQTPTSVARLCGPPLPAIPQEGIPKSSGAEQRRVEPAGVLSLGRYLAHG